MERSLLVAKGFCEVEIVAALRERGGRREHDGDGGARTPLSLHLGAGPMAVFCS